MSDDKPVSGRLQIYLALIAFLGILATGVLSNIDKITQALTSQGPVTTTPTSPSDEVTIAGSYQFETDAQRLIKILPMGNGDFSVAEPISPWPWEGVLKVSGRDVSGFARFTQSQARMDITGEIQTDGTIMVDYTFLTKGDGTPADGRVDRHVWQRRLP